jgi:hypothetical protein
MLYTVTYGGSTRTGRQVRYRPCYISPMVRRLVYIFAAIIALQFSWTAVSAYCTHETGRAAQHFGHHQHVEDGDEVPVASKDAPSVVKKFAVHAHCASCHHATVAIGTWHAPLYLHWTSAAPIADVLPLTSIYTSPPERPQWDSAA